MMRRMSCTSTTSSLFLEPALAHRHHCRLSLLPRRRRRPEHYDITVFIMSAKGRTRWSQRRPQPSQRALDSSGKDAPRSRASGSGEEARPTLGGTGGSGLHQAHSPGRPEAEGLRRQGAASLTAAAGSSHHGGPSTARARTHRAAGHPAAGRKHAQR
jgi:hypothetical protein